MKPQNRGTAGSAIPPLTGAQPELRPQKRYSFVETPVEMRGSARRSEQDIPPLPALPNSLPLDPRGNTSVEHPVDRPPERTSSPYSFPPLAEPHPAQFAPYADMPSQQDHGYHGYATSRQPPHLPQTPNTPSSPGPVPMKADLQLEEQSPALQPSNKQSTANQNPTRNPQEPFPAPPRVFSSYQPDPGAVAGGITMGHHTPGQISHPNQRVIGGGWTHGLCDCGDVSACCTGLFCPCLLYGRTQYRLGQKSTKKDATNMLGYEACNGSCIAFSVLCGFQWLLTTIQHTRIRKAYEIEGSYGSDCIRSCYCCCCVLVQDEREMKHREDHARRNAGPASGGIVAPYVSAPTMNYAPPPR